MNTFKKLLDDMSVNPALADRVYSFVFPEDMYPPTIPDEMIEEKFLLELFRKSPAYSLPGVSKSENAINTFFEGERRCMSYNNNFSVLFTNSSFGRFLNLFRGIFRSFIGHRPKMKFCSVTSGATTNVGTSNNPAERFLKPEMTYELFDFLTAYGPPSPNVVWDWKKVSLVRGNKALLVPKNLKTDRLVCPEPSCNAAGQREVGVFFANKLKKFGLDISSGQIRHQERAYLGSILNNITTDDQSNASGHVYTSLVRFLCTDDWFELLNALRSHYTYIETSPIQAGIPVWWENQGFISQGNGFCFELETIIFLSLIRACSVWVLGRDLTKDEVSVFGDDAIYPSQLTFFVRKVFKNIGFVINEEKSFSDSNFRESCGGDFLNGHNVRTVFFKKDTSHSYNLTILANQVFDFLQRESNRDLPNIENLWYDICETIPLEDRLWGPPNLGDIVLKTNDRTKWDIKYLGKHKKSRIRSWSVYLYEKTDLGELISQGLSPTTYFNLVLLGELKGFGLIHNGDKCEYTKFPKGGSRARIGKSDTFFSEYQNPVDFEDPLSVFEPGRVAMPIWMYNDVAYKAHQRTLRTKLLKLLHAISEEKGTFDGFSIEVDF